MQPLKAQTNDEALPAPEAAVEILECRHGTMLTFRSDDVIGRSLRLYGEWSEHELCCLRRFVHPGTTVIDVGAHIGTHTLAFAKWVLDGKVIAVEPQTSVMCLLQVNCLLNGITNVEIVNAACAGKQGEGFIKAFDPSNLGSTAFKVDTRFLSKLHRMFHSQSSRPLTSVPVLRIDDLAANRNVSLIKVDAEGMEFEVLNGARTILRACRPAVFCEQNDICQLSAIYDLLVGFNYRLYWLETHQFNQANFRGERDNVWCRTETGILAIHGSCDPPTGLIEVDRNAAEIPSRYDAREGLVVA